MEAPASDSPSGLCVPEKWLPAHLDLRPPRAQLPSTESAGFSDLARYALAPSAAPADSWPGVPGRGGGLPMTAALTGRRHLSHSPGAAPRLVVCPPPQEACLLPSGPGLAEPQVCRGLGVPSVGPPPAPPSCPPRVCWGSPCQAGRVPELSALTSVSAFLRSPLPSIDVLLQTCFQGETLLPGHPAVPGGGGLAPRAPMTCLRA